MTASDSDLAAAGRAIEALAAGEVGHVRTLDHPLLAALGVTELAPGSRPAVWGCLDWTERSPHAAGRLGSAVLAGLVERRWVLRRPTDRALNITDHGTHELGRLGIRIPTRSAA